MEDILNNLGIVGILIGLVLFGGGFLTKLKNKKALDKNDKDNKIVAEKEKEVTLNDVKLKKEESDREELRKEFELEKGREVSDEELNDFFDDRYGNK